MLWILFWNMNRNPRAVDRLVRMVREQRIGIVVLAEEPVDAGTADALLDISHGEIAQVSGLAHRRVSVYSVPQAGVGPAVGGSAYMTVHPVRWWRSRREILLAGVHGISRLEDDLADVDEEACVAAGLVREVEGRRRHRRTVVIGDLNLNPFDAGMAKARGFFGVMSQADARRRTQRLKFNEYPLFYNPMWGRLGDGSRGPPGTFYRARSSHLSYYWHTYDQVLLRPDLLPAFDAERLIVPERAGAASLLRGGRPDVARASDHLPLVIGLDVERL